MPKVIKDIVDKVFIGNMSIDSYKSQCDSEILERHIKMAEENRKRFSLFNKRKIEKATKHLNDEMDESVEEFYKFKKRKRRWLITLSYRLNFLPIYSICVL